MELLEGTDDRPSEFWASSTKQIQRNKSEHSTEWAGAHSASVLDVLQGKMNGFVSSPHAVVLRRLQAEDAPAHAESISESWREIVSWMPWAHADYSQSDSLSWISSLPEKWTRGESYDFGIFCSERNCVLGACGLYDIDSSTRKACLSYWIRTSQAGRGYATAAAFALLNRAFREFRFLEVQLVIGKDNVPSIRVAEKLRFLLGDGRREELVFEGRPSEVFTFCQAEDHKWQNQAP
jgi:RimJ/RimL family protein N-acetyltransferase